MLNVNALRPSKHYLPKGINLRTKVLNEGHEGRTFMTKVMK
jgi:hypothetical protein